MIDTKELRRLLAEATPGDWELLASPPDWKIIDSNGDTVAIVPTKNDGRELTNARLIVALCNEALTAPEDK
jgi:hypothetical protein